MNWNAVGMFWNLYVFRSVNSFFIQTFFQPDEYFQALEPAWHQAFGPDSGAWMTWEWREGIRSSFHPLLYSGAYKAASSLCDLTNVDPSMRSRILHFIPGLLSAFFAATMDFSTWQLARRVYGPGSLSSPAALMLTLCNPWQYFASTRSFSNSLEAALTAAALALFPWDFFLRNDGSPTHPSSPRNLSASLVIAAIAVILRPTNIIIWTTLALTLIILSRNSQHAFTLLQTAAVCGSGVLVVSAAMDRTFYGRWAFPPLDFLYLNVVQNLSEFYGKNRIDYYFTEGLPLLLTTSLPFAGIAIWSALRARSTANRIPLLLTLPILTTIIILTAISHKEVRFIYPLLPLLHVLAARPFAISLLRLRPLSIILLTILLAINISIAYYTTTIHQRGVIDVTHFLRTTHLDSPHPLTTAFLMPCHSTPWRSHLQFPSLSAWALTCEPPLSLSSAERKTYLDEADVFYADPALWLQQNMYTPALTEGGTESEEQKDMRAWPKMLVFFEALQPVLEQYSARPEYREIRRFFNTHWIDDWRRRGDVVVWERVD